MIDYKSEEFKKWKRAVHFYKYTKEYKELYGEDGSKSYTDDGNRTFAYLKVDLEKKKKLVKILEEEFNKKHSKGGRKPKLSIEDKLNATIEFDTDKKTYLELAKKYNIHESNMYDNINWVIDTLKEMRILYDYNDGISKTYRLDLDNYRFLF